MTSLTVDGQKFSVQELEREEMKRIVKVDGNRVQVEILKELNRDPLELLIRAGSRAFRVLVAEKDEVGLFEVRLNGTPFRASLEIFEEVHSPRALPGPHKGPILVVAPMAGRIVSLKVAVGTVAEEGQSLFVLEAMKMENEVGSPTKGLVKEIYVQVGALVKAGDSLALVD